MCITGGAGHSEDSLETNLDRVADPAEPLEMNFRGGRRGLLGDRVIGGSSSDAWRLLKSAWRSLNVKGLSPSLLIIFHILPLAQSVSTSSFKSNILKVIHAQRSDFCQISLFHFRLFKIISRIEDILGS